MLIGLIVVVVVFAIYLLFTYNDLVKTNNIYC